MQSNINTLSDFFTSLSNNLESTKQLVNKTDLWLITPNISEVAIIDRSTVITAIREIVKYGRTYIENVVATFEIINFIVKWPKI
jgi:hypothetical protein